MSPNVWGCPWFELPISFCAKNASTTTIRIGKAALLKNLLMKRKSGAGRAWPRSLELSSVASGLRAPSRFLCDRSSSVHSFNAATYGKFL